MRDIQDFYRSEMIRNGFNKNNELPLEISDGSLTIYPVRGQDPEESYSGRRRRADLPGGQTRGLEAPSTLIMPRP